MGRFVRIIPLLVLLLSISVPARPASAIDLSGRYVSVLQALSTPCSLTFQQTGGTLSISGPCTLGTTTYIFQLTGTVNVGTGAFSTTGVLLGLCETPGQVTMSGTGDGETFTGTSTCATIASAVSGTKCNNGVLDATEDCEDGNTNAGDCCSPTCQFDGPGTACAPDTDACTADVCNGTGQCQHPIDPGAADEPCPDDFNECTDDVCDASGQCVHPLITGSCDDLNACTLGESCSTGECTGGTLAPECVGSIDLTGQWELSVAFMTSARRRFVQTGAVLESTNPTHGVAGTGTVNPATGAFRALTPFSIFGFPCLEIIDGTATSDASEFSGTVNTYCQFGGAIPPQQITGRRCDASIECACAASTPCASSTTNTRLALAKSVSATLTRWRWDDIATYGNLGDPTVSGDFSVCLETADGSFVERALHGSKWRKTRSGFRYTDTAGPIRRLWVKSVSRGAFLPWDVSFAMSLAPTVAPSMPLTTPIRMRLVKTTDTGSICFEANFENAITNTSRRFRARD